MTLTRTTNFELYQAREGTPNIFIVFLSSSDGAWMLSTVNRTDIFSEVYTVYPLLKNNPQITQSIDLYSHKSTIGHTTINLVNTKYRQNSSGEWVSLSDELLFSENEITVTVLVMTGYNAEFNDMLQVFRGTVVGEPTYNEDTLTLVAEDIGAELLRKKIPDAPVTTSGSFVVGDKPRLPVVIGDYTGEAPFGETFGLVPCALAHSTSGELLVIPNEYEHTSLVNLWVYIEEGDMWMKLDTTAMNINLNNSSSSMWGDGKEKKYYPIVQNKILEGWIYIAPKALMNDAWGTGVWDSQQYKDGANNVSELRRAADGRIETGGWLYNGNVDGRAMCAFNWDNVKTTNAEELRGHRAFWDPSIDEYERRKFWKAVDTDTWVMSTTDIKLYWNVTTNPDYTYSYKPSSSDTTGWYTNVIIHTPTQYTYVSNLPTIFNGDTNWINMTDLSGENFANTIGWDMGDKNFEVNFTAHTAIPSIDWVLRINACYLAIKATIGKPLNTKSKVFAEVAGIVSGSEIINRGTGYTQPFGGFTYSHNTELQWAGHQIEQLLREYGLTSFDTDLFDAAYNYNIRTRAILHPDRPVTMSKFIQELSENSNFVIFFNVSGKIKLVALDQTPPASPDTIHYEDLLEPPTVSLTNSERVVNRLEYYYLAEPHSGALVLSGVAENETSQSKYGIKEKTARFRYVYHEDIINLTDMLVGNSDAFLANRHNKVFCRTKGLSKVHLEIGDWMQFDAESLDPHMKFVGGTSWSGEEFLIIKKSINDNSTDFVGIQLT